MKRPPRTVDLPPAPDRMRLRLIDYLRDIVESVNALVTRVDPVIVNVTGAYTARDIDRVIQVAPTGTCTITLPLAAKVPGQWMTVKRSNGTTHVITVQPAAGNIDGSASMTLTTAWQVRHFFSDGALWTTH